MSRINQFKDRLAQGEKQFFANYEAPINKLFDGLEGKGLLNSNFDVPKVKRIMKLIQTSNYPAGLVKNLLKLVTLPEPERNQITSYLSEKGFRVENIPGHYLTVLCHMYQVTAERLKLNFVTLIDFSKLGLEDADKQPLGPILEKLRKNFPTNNFVNFLSTKIRNPVTHYSYYFENGKLYLCNGYFDQNPREVDLAEFMMESKKLNILTESFLLIYLDRYRPGEDLILEE